MGLSRIMATSVVVGTLLFGFYYLVSGTVAAQAQQDEKCWRKVEDYDVHFNIYQPAFGDRSFCQEAPGTGDTNLTLDFIDPALRRMPTEVRIIEAASWNAAQDSEEDGVGKPVKQLPSKTYSTGTVLMAHKFNAPGYFVEIVGIQDSTGKKHVLRFPFQLGHGAGLNWSLAWIGAVVGLVALILVIALWLQRRNRQRVIEL
ncbi:MAG: hypothetical protein ACT4QB_16460 [Gammaproteobacteria bacterium]